MKGATVLGGSSGVGLALVKYLKSAGMITKSMSRSNGYDFSSPIQARTALKDVSGPIAVCVGGGKKLISQNDEISLYRNVIDGIAEAARTAEISLVVAVVRSLVLSEVRQELSAKVTSPWVLFRPGPLVDPPSSREPAAEEESLLVTPDIRCNGLVSRRGVARVVGDLVLEKIPIEDMNTQVFGIYDEARMIYMPVGSIFHGTDLWRHSE